MEVTDEILCYFCVLSFLASAILDRLVDSTAQMSENYILLRHFSMAV